MANERALLRPEETEEEGMLRMSFLEHLEELRGRILKAIAGIGVAFLLSTWFGDALWKVVALPAMTSLHSLGYAQRLVFTTPTEAFVTVYFKMPMLASLFLASPWVLYQVWAFVSPGLYRRERRWGAPFILISAGLFILGGVFGYFVAFRSGLGFLLGVGKNLGIEPMVSVSEYFGLFVDVMVGLGLVFELPVLIFLLALLGVVTPAFLLRHSRIAIILIVIVAAAVTQTQDAFDLAIFAAPMVALYFLGVLAAYLLTLHRERRQLVPGRWVVGLGGVGLLGAGIFLGWRGGFHVTRRWPFLTR
jgi:sec-independent protein translocase protein TatC